MLDPPDLADAAIIRELRTSFGLEGANLAFLPVGNDSGSWAYRVQEPPGLAYFLKVRAPADDTRGAEVPAYLRRHGVPSVLAPLPASSGTPWVRLGRFALALYPMIEGSPAADVGMSAGQWRELGAVVRKIHGTPVTPELTKIVRREVFRPTRYELMDEVDALLTSSAPGDPVARELAAFWTARIGLIRELAGQVDALGRRLERLPFPQVLCHADLHTWNVLVDSGQRLWIADWDDAILAPRERDLMFVIRGIIHGLAKPGDTDSFLQGYGQTTIDQGLLAYYRYAWAVQDIAACAEEILLRPARGEDTRRAALDSFRSLFEPGNIVDLAFASEISPAIRERSAYHR